MFKPGDIVREIRNFPNGAKMIVVRQLPTAPDWAIRSYVLQNTVDGSLYEGFESQLARLEEDGTWKRIKYKKEPLLPMFTVEVIGYIDNVEG